MKYLIILSLLICLSSCNGQQRPVETVAHPADWWLDPYTPSQDSLARACSLNSDRLVRVQGNADHACDLYYWSGTPYTGWACTVITDNRHKFRFEQFKDGEMIRRIGYYDNGKLDFDFRMKDCENYGPSRMWMYEDGMYLEEYYSPPGIKHGIHKRWYKNGELAREAQYDNGVLLYEKAYDPNGRLKK